MIQDPHLRPNRLDIDTGAVAHHVRRLAATLGGARIFAAVKADGYGFGALPCGRAAVEGGACGLALAERGQAIALRQAGIAVPILLYAGAPLDAAGIGAARRFRLIPTLLSAEEIDCAAALADGPLDVALKVEVGAERLGVLPEAVAPLAARIAATGRLRLAIVNAHPTFRADAPDAVVQAQFDRFRAAVAPLPAAGQGGPLRLFASSKVMRRVGAGMAMDAIDPGQMLFDEAEDRPVLLRLSSRLIQVRAVTRDFAPEHAPFPLQGVTRIGVIPFGKVDGGGRCHGAEALVGGRRAKLLGTALEYTRLDLSAHPDARAGDEVVLIGTQGDAAITLAETCAAMDQRPTDLAMTVGPLVARRWL